MKSYSQIYIMAVFGVKYRLGLISREWQDKLYAVIGSTINEIDGVRLVCIGGVSDHVHVLFSTRGLVAEEEIVRKMKTESSMWVNANRLTVGRFAWQRGGARISYSYSALEDVKRYISNQAEHHGRVSFREEFERLFNNVGYQFTKYDLPEPLEE